MNAVVVEVVANACAVRNGNASVENGMLHPRE